MSLHGRTITLIGFCSIGMCSSSSQWRPGAFDSRLLAADQCVAYERFDDLTVECSLRNLTTERVEIDPALAIAELPGGRKEPSVARSQAGDVTHFKQFTDVVVLGPGERKRGVYRFHADGFKWEHYDSVRIELRDAVRVAGAPVAESIGLSVSP